MSHRTPRMRRRGAGNAACLGSAFNAMAEHIGQDITGRAAAEAALQDAEERMRFALESSQVGIWDAEMATGRARWSNVLEGLHGLVPGTFKGSLEAFMSHIDPDDRDHVRAAMEQATRDDVEIRLLYRAVWPDRSIHWIRIPAACSATPTARRYTLPGWRWM